MPIRVRQVYDAGATLTWSLERPDDGVWYDFSDSTFKANPATRRRAVTEGTGDLAGRYTDDLTVTPGATFVDGRYVLYVHDAAIGDQVVSGVPFRMVGGDVSDGGGGGGSGATASEIWNFATRSLTDKAGFSLATPPPTAAAIADAVWDEAASDHVAAGSFGSRIDAAISTRSTFAGGAVASVTAPVTVGTNNDKTGYALTVAPPTAAAIADAVWDEATAGHAAAGSFGARLDVAVSTRSTFAGGAVASVTAPVTVGTNNDKTGYALAIAPPTAAEIWGFSSRSLTSGGGGGGGATAAEVWAHPSRTLTGAGLDAISVESGLNLRQAAALILSATAGVLSGADQVLGPGGTGLILIYPGGVQTVGGPARIEVQADRFGNRHRIVLNPPA